MTQPRTASSITGLHNWHVDDVLLFCALVDAGGFSAAARLTGVPKARLSRRIAALEADLGIRLVERTTRSFRITDAGDRLLEHARNLRTEAERISAIAAAYNTAPTGALRVGCPLGLADAFVSDTAMGFMASYPEVQLTFDVIDTVIPPTFDRYDIIIMPSRSGFADSTSVAKRMMMTPYRLVASPALVARAGMPETPDDLHEMSFLGWWDSPPRDVLLLESTEGVVDVSVSTSLRTNNLLVVKNAAIAGAGFASLPAMICEQELECGTLVQILERYAPPPMRVHACFPTRRSLTAAGRAFLSLLETRIEGLGAS